MLAGIFEGESGAGGEVLNPESDLNDEMTKLTEVEVIGFIRTIGVEALKDE